MHRTLVHGPMEICQLLPFWGRKTLATKVANKSGQQECAGNKRHNTRMLSRKLVLIFKALHYLHRGRWTVKREEAMGKGGESERDNTLLSRRKVGYKLLA